jgi:hypothetical protein
MSVQVDVWVRGTLHAKTYEITSLPSDPASWGEQDVRHLLSEMLSALQREKDPGGEPTTITLRGFSWIVSPYESGVLVHLEMQLGTASAGPLRIDEQRLSTMVSRVMTPADKVDVVH